MNKYEKMYEDILLACRTGEVVIVKNKNNQFQSFYFWNEEEFRAGGWRDSIKDSKRATYFYTYDKHAFIKYAEEYDWTIVKTYTPEYDRVPVGTKVLVKHKKFNQFVSMISEYQENNMYAIKDPKVNNTWILPRSAFTVILPEEKKVEEPKTITLDGVEYILTPKQNA